MDRDNSEDEIEIAKNIINHINNPDFMNKEIASLDRILGYYFDQKNIDPKEEKEVINFLFKYYDSKGNKACVFFMHIKNSPERLNIVIRLYHQYRRKFDFNFINPSLLLSTFDIIKTNEKLKKVLFFLLAFIPLLAIISISSYFQTEKVKKNLNKQLNDQIQANEKLQIELKTVQQKYENDKKINKQLDSEINKRFSNLKEEMQSIKENFQKELISVKEKQQEDEELKKCKESFQNEHECNMKLENELTKCSISLKDENENKMKLENELTKCNISLKDENENKTRIYDELKICNNDKLKLENELLNMKNTENNKRSIFGMIAVITVDAVVVVVVIIIFLWLLLFRRRNASGINDEGYKPNTLDNETSQEVDSTQAAIDDPIWSYQSQDNPLYSDNEGESAFSDENNNFEESWGNIL